MAPTPARRLLLHAQTMNSRLHRALAYTVSTAVASLALLVVLLLLPCAATATLTTATTAAQTATAATDEPLPESDYAIRTVCGTPRPGRASCMALELEPATATARARTHPLGITRTGPIAAGRAAEGAYGLSPDDLRDAYFPGAGEQPDAPTGKPQTIALVDAYNDYATTEDLRTYDEEFDLPELPRCTSPQQSSCFEQVDQEGSAEEAKLPFPHDEAELTERDEACEIAFAKAQQDGTGLSAAAEKDCVEAKEAGGWAVEISTDIETAHAVCQNCKILLVEGGKPSYGSLKEVEEVPSYRNLGEAVRTAVGLGASEVSNSWAGPEPDLDEEQELKNDGIDFDYPDTVVTAAAGDGGYLNWTDAEKAEEERSECLEYARTLGERRECEEISYSVGANYPASSPDIVAVGGTKLTVNASSGARESESVWNEDPDPKGGNDGGGGSGCSERFTAPPWQQAVPDWTEVGCGSNRAVADIAADADPYTGVAVYDSVPDLRVEENAQDEEEIVDTPLAWEPIGGTSVASPIIASMFALAGGANGIEYPAATLYSHLETTSLHAVTSGGNGKCDDDYLSCSGSLNQGSALYPFDCGEGELICNAAPGCEGRYYDGPTGVGTPDGIAALEPGKQPSIVAPKCPPASKSGDSTGSAPDTGSGSESGGDTSGGEAAPPPSTASGASPANSTSGATPSTTTGAAATTSERTIVRLTAFALTPTALLALNRAQPKVSSLGFAFTLSAADRVRATLAKLVRVHGHNRWQAMPDALTFSAARGRNRRHLTNPDALTPGRYRLTLAPQGGAARTLTFRVG